MREYYTDKIVMSRRYTPAQAERAINIPARTIFDWLKSGRLVRMNTRRTMFTGQRLLEAVEDRGM